jgi:NAD-dependent SIR2 family protein deacetylase
MRRSGGVPSDLAERNIGKVARLLAEADALLITAGAGMGVDSGLPDFRGNRGFWRAYPPLEKLGISFEEMAQPGWFAERPEMAWAFYGHRQQLYRETKPHMGYHMLHDWGRTMRGGHFVVTSNVDGAFATAGFDSERILEQHGNIHRLQCAEPCGSHIWVEAVADLGIDLTTLEAKGQLPRCPECGALARPNVLMFGDPEWVPDVTREQERRYRQWLASVRGRRLVIVELGAGRAIATIRMMGERLTSERDRVTLVRINPEASEADEPAIPIRMGALEALRRVEEKLPETFRAKARAGMPIVRPEASAQAVVRGPEGLPQAERSRELEIVDLLRESERVPGDRQGAASVESADLERRTGKIRLKVGTLTQIELGRGLVGLVETCSISFDDELACMLSYVDAQQAWVPMPEVAGLSAPGYTMRAGVIHGPESDRAATPGTAIVFVQAPDEQAVITLGLARRASDGPFLWSLLYRTAITALAPLDYPRVPWVARRPDGDLSAHAEVMSYLKEFERSLAWGWLRLAAFIDVTRPKRDGP